MSYRQLALHERYQISALRLRHFSPAEIARMLQRSRSTITRELRRNQVELQRHDGPAVRYQPIEADQRARKRRAAKGAASRKIQGELREIVESKLRQAWSPEQISGRLRHEFAQSVSFETIYQHVIRDAAEMNGTLRYCLRFGGYKNRRLREGTRPPRNARKQHIDDRPDAANERREVGHWERDCVLGTRGDSAFLTMVDRKSRFSRIRHIAKVSVEHVARETCEALRRLEKATITNDNGHEFERALELEQQLGVKIYFCDPHSPWQRGSIENFNGLLRQFVPKHTNIDSLPSWAATILEDTLNHRPRKTLGFRTPHEVFFNARMKLMSPLVRFGLEFSC